MIYKRRYIQFNNLVFDGYDMIREASASASTKIYDQEYTYRHGNYVAFKKPYMLFEPSEISITIKLAMKKLPCNMREYYRSFAIGELTKPGKLWAVQNGELVWAYAYLTNFDEDENSLKDTIEIVVDFVAYEGVWHKADKQKTFLKPYDVCDFLDCEDFQTIDPCATFKYKEDTNCCVHCGLPKKEDVHNGCECCECYELDPSWALCMFDDFEDFYKCNTGYQIEYNCRKGEEFFGDEYLGTKICQNDPCSNIIAGQLYSDTDIPTDDITIILSKGGTNPRITINDTTNVITGSYEGALIVKPNGDVVHKTDCCEEVLDPSAWEIPPGQEYGWEIHRGMNRVIIDNCCGGMCAYFQVGSLTI